jgi:hypothetical protein
MLHHFQVFWAKIHKKINQIDDNKLNNLYFWKIKISSYDTYA